MAHKGEINFICLVVVKTWTLGLIVLLDTQRLKYGVGEHSLDGLVFFNQYSQIMAVISVGVCCVKMTLAFYYC